MTLYTLDRITQRYNNRTVLDIDRLEIESGGIYALLGPNGAGKTTLLNILGFLDAPTSGQLSFRGRIVNPSRTTMQHLRRQVVLVDQHPIMFSTSVCNNIEFGLKIRKIEKARRQRIIDEALDTVGLRSFKHAEAHALSGGETQRLALARALALEPAILLCDEPTASVDAENQAVIRVLLQRINEQRGTTILFTTHDRLQAAALAGHTLVLENGRLAKTTYENSYACTLDVAANDTLRCRLHDKVELPLALQPSDRPQSSGTHRIYIDPEKISLCRTDEQHQHNQKVAGTIVLVMAEGEKIRVVVNIGLLIVVLMDRTNYQREHPAIGETVHLDFATDAVTLLGSSAS